MSAFFCVIPVLSAGWPVFTAAATAAAAALGYRIIESAGEMTGGEKVAEKIATGVEIELENSAELASSLKRGEVIKFEKDGITAEIRKGIRGEMSMCVDGKGKSRKELEKAGRELLDRITQKYVYNRVVGELKKAGFILTDEKVEENGEIKIRVRKWMGN